MLKEGVVKKPVVSVIVVTYNHRDYIKQCLDGILMQQTTFPFEIILGEDESNDGTREICIDYANTYPDKICLFLRSRKDVIYINNRPTGRFNFIENIKAAKGKYIAICEGDDYWTDPLKLQKQVDFLEANPSYGICFHNILQKSEFEHLKEVVIPNVNENIDFSIEDYVTSNKTATCSMVFNSNYFSPIPEWFSKLPFGDLGIILTVMKHSNKKGRVLKDIMAVYRIHSGGIHGSFHKNNKGLIKAYKQHLQFNAFITKYLLNEPEYKKVLLAKKRNAYKYLSKTYKNEKHYFLSFKYRCLMSFCKFINVILWL